jgi:outer membrane protein W
MTGTVRLRSAGTFLALVLACGPAIAEQGDAELGLRLLWVTGSATSSGTVADTGSAVKLSSGPGVELDWLLWPFDELTVELSLGLSGHPIETVGGTFSGVDGGTLWHVPVSAVAQYRPKLTDRLDPYVGLGLVYHLLKPRMSSSYDQLLSDLEFSNDLNVVAQVGVVYALDVHWSANLDLRYTGLRTTATLTARDGTRLAALDLKMDPWVVSVGFRVRY